MDGLGACGGAAYLACFRWIAIAMAHKQTTNTRIEAPMRIVLIDIIIIENQ